MAAKSAKGIHGVAIPLNGGVKSIGAIGVAGLDGALAPQGIVCGAGKPRTPLGAGVVADLADHVDVGGAFHQNHGIIAVVPAGIVGLVGLRQNGGVG